MNINRLVYIATARLPTEKAHGYQICKMCEAFRQNGTVVLLLHPYRRQLNPELRRRSVFDYYGVPPVFEVRTLPNWDLIPLNLLIPDKVFAPVVFVHALVWGLYAALVGRRERADLYYTRDSGAAYGLVRLGLPTVYEAHVVPKRAQRWLLRRIARFSALRLVVALTSFIAKQFVELGFPAEKVVVLSDGVDLSLITQTPIYH